MSLNFKTIIKIIGTLLGIVSFSMLPSLFLSLYLKETSAAFAFGVTASVTMGVSALFIWRTKGAVAEPRLRDGMLIVCLGWFLASVAGAFPYMLSQTIPSFPDALFESVSGFTTTGATVFSDIEALPRGIIFWRSLCQWLGGMGILVFVISILPSLGINGHNILNAETPGIGFHSPGADLKRSAQKLYLVYVSMTALQVLLLCLGGISFFDSMVLSLGSISSSGLTNYNNGLLHFNSLYIESVIAVFMLLSCVNFSLYYYALQRRFKKFWQNTEFKAFIGIAVVCSVFVSLNLNMTHTYPLRESFRYGIFQTISFLTTTGSASADFLSWPTFSKTLLTTLTFIGGSSSSTGGAIKVIRIVILSKLVWRSFTTRIHPNAVVGIKLEGKPIPSNTVNAAMAFFLTYFVVFLTGAFVISFDTNDFQTALLASSSLLGTTGASFGEMGIFGNYSIFSSPTKLFMCLLMLAGRLEIYAVLLLGSRTFWNPNR